MNGDVGGKIGTGCVGVKGRMWQELSGEGPPLECKGDSKVLTVRHYLQDSVS